VLLFFCNNAFRLADITKALQPGRRSAAALA